MLLKKAVPLRIAASFGLALATLAGVRLVAGVTSASATTDLAASAPPAEVSVAHSIHRPLPEWQGLVGRARLSDAQANAAANRVQRKSPGGQAAATRRATELAELRLREGTTGDFVLLNAGHEQSEVVDAVAQAETCANIAVVSICTALGGENQQTRLSVAAAIAEPSTRTSQSSTIVALEFEAHDPAASSAGVVP